jgi:sec-independent protein translocase protein TatA
MPSIGPMELIVVLVIALVVLGPKRLPSAGRALGEGIRGFKETVTGATPTEAQLEVAGDEQTTLSGAGS